MKRMTPIATFISFLLLFASIVAAQTPNNNAPSNQAADAALLRQLAAEVKTLKAEVFRLQLELQQARVARWERELERALADKQKLESKGAEIADELATLDQHLSLPSLTPEEREEMEKSKEQLASAGADRARAEQQSAAQDEIAIRRRLAQERERWLEMAEKARKLGVDVSDYDPEAEKPLRPARRSH